jgi:hypothetical protein
MRTVLAATVILTMVRTACAAGLAIYPVSPSPGEVRSVGDSTAVVLRTAPGAVCYVDIHAPGTPAVHKAAERAGADGTVSWAPDELNSSGKRELTAYCSLNGEHVQRQWTYSVE